LAENFRPLSDASASFLGTGRANAVFQFRITPSSTSLAENFRPLNDAFVSFLGTGRASAVFQFRISPASTKPMQF
jgi:hypothetical protein